MATTHPTTTVRAVGYARVSEDDQMSVPEQLAWIEDTARREGAELVRVYTDEGRKGYEIDSREQLQRMLDDVEAHSSKGRPVQLLLTWTEDRLSRADSLETARVLCRLRDAGTATIISATTRTDLHNAQDRLLFNLMQDTQRSAFSPKLSLDVARSMLQGARAGLWQGGPAPYGYRIVDGRLVPGDDRQVEAVRFIFTSYAEGRFSTRKLPSELDRLGYPPPRGKRWSRITVHKILRSRLYIGELVWNQRHKGKFTRLVGGRCVPTNLSARELRDRRGPTGPAARLLRNDQADVIRVPGAHPPLIDADAFIRVQALLSSNKRATSPSKSGIAALRGLTHCAACGASCYVMRRTWTTPSGKRMTANRLCCSAYWAKGKGACGCGGWASEHDTQQAVVRILQQHLSDPAAVAELRKQAIEDAAQIAAALLARRKGLERRMADADAELGQARARLLKIAEDLLPDAQQELRSMKEARAGLEQELRSLDADEGAVAVQVSPEELDKQLALIGSLTELAERPEQELLRNAFRALIQRVDLTFTRKAQGKKGKGIKLHAGAPIVAVTLARAFADLLRTACRSEQVCIVLRDKAS